MNKRAGLTFFLTCALAMVGVGTALAQGTNTITALSASTNSSCYGQPVTFNAVVTSNPAGLGTPTGTVGFADGPTVIDTETLDASGRASFSTASLGAGPHSITAQYNGDSNFNTSTSSILTETVNTSPAINTQPASRTLCVSNLVTFTAAASGSPTPALQWQVSTNSGTTFANITGATATNYSFTVSFSDNGKQYRAQFSNTCGVVPSAVAALTVNALPGCLISGADAVCANSINHLYSAPAGLTAYRWSVTGSATLSGPTNAPSASVNAGASGTFTLTLTVTNASGCSSTCSKTVTNLALPTAVVSGGGAICPGNSTNIQAALSGAGPWTLIWSDGFTQANVATSPATRTVSPATTTSYGVTTVTGANCSNSGSGSATVTVSTAPVVTGNPANKTVCAGSSVSFAGSAGGSPTPAAQWQVSLDGGLTFTNLPGATSSTYTFTASLSDSGKSFRVLFTNPCGSALSGAASLVVNPVPSAMITADPIVCANSTGNAASVPYAGVGASYGWTVSGGTITSGTGTSSIIYTAGGSGTITITVSVTNAQGCSTSGSQSVAFASQGKNLEGWKNKAPLQWQGSTFNNGDHQYSEGNSLPVRLELSQMCPGASWCVVLLYDFKDGNTSRHFYDFLDTYNSSEGSVNGQACDNFNCSGVPTTFPIPTDPSLSYQLPANFTVYNGAITNVSTYSTVSGSTIEKQLTISGVTAPGGGAKDVLILFGGHLARENEWGPGNGASSFPGASAKVLYQFCGDSSFGNFAVNPAGIIKQADLSLTKTATPNPLCAGNTLTYSLVVANSGPDQATTVTVLDSLPAGTTPTSVSLSQGSYSGTTNLNFALGAINAGSNATITLVVTVNTNVALGTITNTATVSAVAPADPFMLNNTATALTMVFPRPTASPLSDQIICPGGPVAFSTIAIGAPPFSYQWTRNGSYLPGATNSAFSIPAASPSDAGAYCVIVSGQCNGVFNTVTNCASVTVGTSTSLSPLADLVKCPGENATFSTTTAGTGPFSFVWKKDGVPIPGATLNALTLTKVTAADAGAYCVEITGACNATNSCAMLTVRTNTSATALVSQVKCPGETATFGTVATGTGPFTYVWKKDGVILPGQTRDSLTVASVSAAQAGSYCVEVTGNCNGITNCAVLTVRTPTTAEPLVSQTYCPGATASFSTTAHGDGPFTYKWIKDGKPLPGATTSSWSITNVTVLHAGTYVVLVTGTCNAVTNAATLTVHPPTTATELTDQTLCSGLTATFSTTAGGTGPFSYIWRKNGLVLPGQTSDSLTIPHLKAIDAGAYTVEVSGFCDSVTNAATLTVQPPTTATALTNQTLCFGLTATFSTTAAGTGPFSYLWRKNGLVLAGQTSDSLTIPRLKAIDAGAYTVEVSGLCNSVTNSATLAVESDGLLSPATFANPTPITIPDFGPATPYPSTIEVSCVPGPVVQMTVTLTNLSHTYASDIGILLVSPTGQAIMLMSDAGGSNPINNAIISFSDAAPNFLPASAPITTGIYKTTDYSPDEIMPLPAPLGPYSTGLAAFNGSDPNGTWSLYVVDDALMDQGAIAGGWSLTLACGPLAVPIRLSQPAILSNRCAQVTLQALSGQTYTIEASSDLLTWTPILTNTLSGPTWDFVDPSSTNFAKRFYRAVLSP